MKRKMLAAFALAFILLAPAVSAPVLAVEGPEPILPYGSDAPDGAQSALNDGGMPYDSDNSGQARIKVWAVTMDVDHYAIDITWGPMKFEYERDAGTWDAANHEYLDPGDAGWITAGYVDGINNRITVTSSSNHAVNAIFAYENTANVFNNDEGNSFSVRGFFFDTNAKALVAAGLDDSANVPDQLDYDDVTAGFDNTIMLHTSERYKLMDDPSPETEGWTEADARVGEVYFAFSGRPDPGRGAVLNDFTKAGVITVTIEPNNDISYVGLEGTVIEPED